MSRSSALRTVTVGLAVSLLLLTACNSGSDSTSSSSNSGGSGAGSADLVAQAKANVADLMARPTTFEVPALPQKPEGGKTVDFVVCPTPTCQDFVPFLKEATDAVGWNLQTVQGGFEPTDITNAWNKVVRDKPDGVIASGGVDPSLFANQLKQLHDDNIPVVLHDQSATDDPAVIGVVLSDDANRQFGQNLADAIIADSNGKDVHLGIFATPQVPVFTNLGKALTETITSDACSGCSVKTEQFKVSDAGSALPSRVVSFLRANPDTNYLFFDFNDAVDGVPAALQQAGLNDQVKLLMNNIAKTESEYMRNDQVWAAAANPWPEVLWQDLNLILTETQGAPLDPALAVKLPNWILTKDNLPEGDASMFPLVENYQDIFKKAWGLT